MPTAGKPMEGASPPSALPGKRGGSGSGSVGGVGGDIDGETETTAATNSIELDTLRLAWTPEIRDSVVSEAFNFASNLWN